MRLHAMGRELAPRLRCSRSNWIATRWMCCAGPS